MNKPILSISKNSITAIFNTKLPPLVIRIGSVMWDFAVEAIKAQDWEALASCLTFKDGISRITHGNIVVLDSAVFYKGRPVRGFISQRILEMVSVGLPVEPILNFLDNLFENPSEDSRNDLYEFVEKNNSPITEDGCFLAYRKVGRDYLSYHKNLDGTRNNNRVGSVVKMDRKGVCADRHQTCAPGLHFCSWDYLPLYYAFIDSRVMLVKINPKNVVSIPVDYNLAKGRCCEYEVVDEIIDCENNKEKFDILPSEKVFSVDNQGVKRYSLRDAHGRFVKKV